MLISKFDNTNVKKFITEFESKYNFKFPHQYKNFLIKYDGGETPKTKFKINRISSDLKGFYGLGNINDHYHYAFFEKIKILNEYLKDNVVPIAKNSFGDILFIGIQGENNGKIYFLYHDRKKQYIELENDFETFVSKCKSEKIGKIRTVDERIEDMKKSGSNVNITQDLIELWQKEIEKFSKMKQEKLIL